MIGLDALLQRDPAVPQAVAMETPPVLCYVVQLAAHPGKFDVQKVWL
jgi:hypothetical protein